MNVFQRTLNRIEQLDKVVGQLIWRFIQRQGRPSVRRMIMVSLAFVLFIIAPSVILLASLIGSESIGSESIGSEQMAVIGLAIILIPSCVLFGGQFAAHVHGVMGRNRSISHAIGYAAIFFAFSIFTASWIEFPSAVFQFMYATIMTIFCAIAAYSLGKKCVNCE